MVEALFKCNGFTTTRNGGGAKPRQTDLMASLRDLHCVVEAKWKKKPSNSADIESLRQRVRRLPTGTIGCLFSAGGFTSGAVALAESEKALEVLLFGRDEIEALARHPIPLDELMRRKQGALRHEGQMKIWEASELERDRRRPVTRGFLGLSNSSRCVVSNTAGHSDILYERCGAWSPYYVEYDFEPGDLGGLARAFDTAQRCLGERLEGAFAIHQVGKSWHGFGFESLLREAGRWRKRYREAGLEDPHHTEVLAYSAGCAGGTVALSSRQFVGTTSHALDARLTVQLDGIPTDPEPLRRLADALGVPPPRILTVGGAGEDDERVAWIRPPLPLRVRAWFTTDEFAASGEPSVAAGVVAENPFFRKSALAEQLLGKSMRFRGIDETELLVCSMRSTHCVGDRVDGYSLIRLDCRWVGGAQVIDAMADWGKVEHCVRSKADRVKRRAEFARSALAELNGGKCV